MSGTNAIAAPQRWLPHIDRNRCEGAGDCVVACPQGVLALGTLGLFDRRALSLSGQLRGWAHDWRQAFAVQPQDCHACGRCVGACPERAITLVAADTNNPAHAPIAAD
ncbi:ferredoxin family protein [Pelomonas sp. UHG3]|uniref:Ferredoxin family protein n=1 Tax=Roseateles hydrophilus TaxID=2975054 RepID=A0ACC6C814_9BURK|nr:ferredoxin family protein [Pelomonas sp. UHG3]MCY4744525.1 ferredoxin family protein [Pelomonas sp. UHG3]